MQVIVGNFLQIAGGMALIIAALGYSYTSWKRGGYQANADLVSTLKDKLEIVEREHKELTAKFNQIIGENKTLRDLLSLQGPETKELQNNILCVLGEVKLLREDFNKIQSKINKGAR